MEFDAAGLAKEAVAFSSAHVIGIAGQTAVAAVRSVGGIAHCVSEPRPVDKFKFCASAGSLVDGSAEAGRALIAKVATKDRVLCCSDQKLRTYKEFKCNPKLR